MRKRESAVRSRSEVIKGSSEGPLWEQKIKTMLLSHLPQSQSHLMWPLQAARPEPTFSRQQITNENTHIQICFDESGYH